MIINHFSTIFARKLIKRQILDNKSSVERCTQGIIDSYLSAHDYIYWIIMQKSLNFIVNDTMMHWNTVWNFGQNAEISYLASHAAACSTNTNLTSWSLHLKRFHMNTSFWARTLMWHITICYIPMASMMGKPRSSPPVAEKKAHQNVKFICHFFSTLGWPTVGNKITLWQISFVCHVI